MLTFLFKLIMTLQTGIIKYYDCNIFNLYDIEAQCVKQPAWPTTNVSMLMQIDAQCMVFD